MANTTAKNVLYLTVLPMVNVGSTNFGLVDQVLTLMPDKNFATPFFPDEVSLYVQTFKNRLKYFIGGHVIGYEFYEEPRPDGRLIVRVIQNVE
ncbi:MAG TPA: hypothetical protein VMD29_12265 [Terracidiphilus sp.]|nr:hypothetical protein [Terracidiphilus sp.]